MALQLKPETEERIERQIASGDYSSADDLVTEALDLLESYEKSVAAELDRRHAAIRGGKVAPMDPEEARRRLQEHHQTWLLRPDVPPHTPPSCLEGCQRNLR